MISRGHMRRQLRASGGITNARQGYGIGSWVKERIRKIIPNELASVASKAAPVVAMFNPAIGGLMRGIGRFDKRGSVSDALKQGIGTYAGGQAARYLGGQGFQKGFGTSGDRFTSPIKSGNKFSNFLDTGKEKLKGLIKTEETSNTAKEILKNQLIIGGGTALVSLISQGLIDEPEQEQGESVNDFMARRKESVSKQLKTYLGNTNKFRGLSDVELDALVAQNMTEYDKDFASGSGGYNQGGRVGLANGSDDMILPMKKPEVERMLTYEEAKALDPQMFVDTTTSNPIPDNAAELAIDELARVILGTRGSDKNFMKNEYIIPTVKKISENYGYSEAEIVKMLKDQMMTYSKPKMNKGGLMGLNRTGFDKGSNPVLSLIEKISPLFVDEDGDYRLGLQKARLALAKLVTKKGYDLGIGAEWYNKLDEDTQKEILLEKIKYREMNPDNDEERREFTMSDGTIKKGAPMYPKRITEMPVYDEADAGRFRYGAAMNKGGLMRLNYMIGGEAKQMEAGAPPIMYSGNMDPNAQAGLPSVPGPMQMAEDGPEFDMRENGGFQPLGRQEGKDDVPAMLAKNEFVMTADAVRAAGGGSIQKGAQKMYDTMKKLESRVS